MRRWLLLLTCALGLAACQTETFPDAPTIVPAATTPSPSSSTTNPQAPHNGTLVATGTHYLEFVADPSANNQGRIFFAFFAYTDSGTTPMPSTTTMSGTVTLKDNGASQAPITLQNQPSGGEPFLYFWPNLTSGHTYQIHADLTVDGEAYSGDFTYQAQ